MPEFAGRIKQLKGFFGKRYKEMLKSFQDESERLFEDMIDLFMESDHYPGEQEFDRILRNLHTLKGITSQNNLSEVSHWIHEIEEIFIGIRKNDLEFMPRTYQTMVPLLTSLFDFVRAYCESDGERPVEPEFKRCGYAYRTFMRIYARSVSEEQLKPDNNHSNLDSKTSSRQQVTAKSIKKRLQAIVSEAGQERDRRANADSSQELRNYIIQEKDLDKITAILCQALYRLPYISDTNNSLNSVKEEIQETILQLQNIRKVSALTLARKLEKVAIDTANKVGKKINFEFIGFETEIDISWYQIFSESLMHMIKNSIDHGVEEASVRRIAGKPETAKLVVEMNFEADRCHLIICDDGGGVNGDIVAKKALEKGVINQKELDAMTSYEKQMLIFEAGFSSKDQATQISGRGVGLDAVQTNVLKRGGSILLDSEVGRGSEFKLTFPIRYYHEPVVVFRYQDARFSVPRRIVNQILYADTAKTVEFGSLTLDQENFFTVLCLPEIDPHLQSFKERPYLMMDVAGAPCALGVDEILGEEDLFFFSFGAAIGGIPYLNAFSNSIEFGPVAALNVLELEANFNSYLFDEESIQDIEQNFVGTAELFEKPPEMIIEEPQVDPPVENLETPPPQIDDGPMISDEDAEAAAALGAFELNLGDQPSPVAESNVIELPSISDEEAEAAAALGAFELNLDGFSDIESSHAKEKSHDNQAIDPETQLCLNLLGSDQFLGDVLSAAQQRARSLTVGENNMLEVLANEIEVFESQLKSDGQENTQIAPVSDPLAETMRSVLVDKLTEALRNRVA